MMQGVSWTRPTGQDKFSNWGNFINTQHAAPCDDCCIPEWEIKVFWNSYKLYCNYCIFSPWYQSAPKQRRDTLVSRIRAFFPWIFFCKSPGFYVPISGFESTEFLVFESFITSAVDLNPSKKHSRTTKMLEHLHLSGSSWWFLVFSWKK